MCVSLHNLISIYLDLCSCWCRWKHLISPCYSILTEFWKIYLLHCLAALKMRLPVSEDSSTRLWLFWQGITLYWYQIITSRSKSVLINYYRWKNVSVFNRECHTQPGFATSVSNMGGPRVTYEVFRKVSTRWHVKLLKVFQTCLGSAECIFSIFVFFFCQLETKHL